MARQRLESATARAQAGQAELADGTNGRCQKYGHEWAGSPHAVLAAPTARACATPNGSSYAYAERWRALVTH
jgi:hypothetical protein